MSVKATYDTGAPALALSGGRALALFVFATCLAVGLLRLAWAGSSEAVRFANPESEQDVQQWRFSLFSHEDTASSGKQGAVNCGHPQQPQVLIGFNSSAPTPTLAPSSSHGIGSPSLVLVDDRGTPWWSRIFCIYGSRVTPT